MNENGAQSLCDEIKRKHKILDYVKSQNIEITERGNKNWIICPFHADKNPSLSIEEKENCDVWHCFGCKKGGTIIDFVINFEKITKNAAIKKLSQGINFSMDLGSIYKRAYENENKNSEKDQNDKFKYLNAQISIHCFQYLRGIRKLNDEDKMNREFGLIDSLFQKIDDCLALKNIDKLVEYYSEICENNFLINRLKIMENKNG